MTLTSLKYTRKAVAAEHYSDVCSLDEMLLRNKNSNANDMPAKFSERLQICAGPKYLTFM